MADIDIERKQKSPLPWVLGLLALAIVAFLLMRGCGGRETPPQEEIVTDSTTIIVPMPPPVTETTTVVPAPVPGAETTLPATPDTSPTTGAIAPTRPGDSVP